MAMVLQASLLPSSIGPNLATQRCGQHKRSPRMQKPAVASGRATHPGSRSWLQNEQKQTPVGWSSHREEREREMVSRANPRKRADWTTATWTTLLIMMPTRRACKALCAMQ